MEPRCRWKIAHACCRWPLPSCLPNSPPRPTVSCARQGLCTRYPSARGQPGVAEPLVARPRTPPGLAGKSQLCCQGTARGPSGSCLPRPGPPRVRSKSPRPWPGARTSSPAQMPPGSPRVGTCLRPRAGIGTRAARPPHLCLPGSLLFCAKFPPPPGWARGAAPAPGAAGSPRAAVSPAPQQRKSPTVGAVPPVPGLGWRSTERQVGGQTGLGSGTRGRLALVESVLRPPSKPRTAQPDLAPGRSPGVGVRLRKRKPLAATTSRQKALTKSCAVPLSGMVSGPPGGMGSGSRARCFPS